MSVVERSVAVTGLVVGLVMITAACGSGLEVSGDSAVLSLPSVPKTSLASSTSTSSTPAVGGDTATSTDAPETSTDPSAPDVGGTGSTSVPPPPLHPSAAATAKGRPHLERAVASGDLCEVNDALEEMVETSHDGLEVASEMREAADGADAARDIVPASLLDAWDVVAASTRRYADALVSAGGDASVPEVRAIRSDAAFERASSRVATWIRDHCDDDGS